MRSTLAAAPARSTTILALALLLVLGARPATAQQPSARRVFVGTPRVAYMDEHYPGWIPITIPIENAGPATTLELVARVVRSNDEDAYVARRTLAVASGAKRRETLYVLADPSCSQVNVQVLEGGRSLAETHRALDFVGTNVFHAPLHAILVHEGTTVAAQPLGWLQWNGDMSDDSAVRVASSVVDPRDLPDRLEGYDSIDLVALAGTSARDLGEERTRALVSWIREGGRVLLLPGSDPAWFRDELLKSLLPADLSVRPLTTGDLSNLERQAQALGQAASSPVSWPSLSPFRVYELRSHAFDADQATPLAQESVRGRESLASLLSCFRLGSGEVVAASVDLDEPPFDRLPFAKQALAQQLFSKLGRVPRARSSGSASDLRAAFAHALNVSEAPSPLLIVPVVVIYVLCVGPLNHKLLRRSDAQVLIVATTPAIALAFTGVIFVIGYLLTGLATVTLRTTVLEARSGDPIAFEKTALSIHSSASSTYSVSLDESVLATRVWPSGVALDHQSQTIAVADGRQTWASVPLNLWEHAFFFGKGLRDLGGSVRVAVGADAIDVQNGTRFALSKGLVFRPRGEAGVPIPPLAPGTSAHVALGQGVAAAPNDVATYLVDGEDARRFVSRLVTEIVPLRGAPSYLALLERSPTAALVDGRAKATRDVPFLIVRLSEDRP